MARSPQEIAAICRKWSYTPAQEIDNQHRIRVCLIERLACDLSAARRFYKNQFRRLARLLAEEPATARVFFETTRLPWEKRDKLRDAARVELRRLRAEQPQLTKPSEG